jgi:hypothetical protein
LNAYIAFIEDEIAESCGYSDFAGQGTYFVPASAAMGLQLAVKEI